MRLEFTKMNGAGNDFILIDNRAGSVHLSTAQIVRLCSRQRGVGADGLLLLIPCNSGKADWAWQFYNSDGSTADMCGNGARCFARFIQKLTGVKDFVSFETGAGVIRAQYHADRVTVNLTPAHGLKIGEAVPLKQGGLLSVHSVNTGVPHAVVFVADADKAMVQDLGAELRYHPHFAPKGTNVNFVELKGGAAIRVRTYERGVEGETLACGTGVSASALISAHVHKLTPPIAVTVQGGDTLVVDFKTDTSGLTQVSLNGPADFTFQGVIEV